MKEIKRQLELVLGAAQLALLRQATASAAGLVPRPADPEAGNLSYFERPGAGVPLVAIHGFGGDKETWLLWAPWVTRKRRLLLVDLVGHGESPPISEPRQATARGQAENVIRLLDHLGIERAILCGTSMGGGVALRTAHDFPDRVTGLVLVASVNAAPADNAFMRRLRSGGENELLAKDEDDGERLANLIAARPLPVPRAIQRYATSRRAIARAGLEKVWSAWINASADLQVPLEVGGITTPTLIVHGDCDRVIDIATAHRLAIELPSARLEVLSGVGHMPHLEAPRPMARLITSFVDQIAKLTPADLEKFKAEVKARADADAKAKAEAKLAAVAEVKAAAEAKARAAAEAKAAARAEAKKKST